MAPTITNTIVFFLTILAVQGECQEIQSGGGGLEFIAFLTKKAALVRAGKRLSEALGITLNKRGFLASVARRKFLRPRPLD